MNEDCPLCVFEITKANCRGCFEGSHYKPKQITNADRIRAMSDEELAEFMCHNVSNGTVNCAFCAVAEFCRMGHNGWLDWLKEEAKGDT